MRGLHNMGCQRATHVGQLSRHGGRERDDRDGDGDGYAGQDGGKAIYVAELRRDP